MKVFVLTGSTESGDDVGPYVFDFCPSTNELKAILMADFPAEFEDCGPDEDFGYITTTNLQLTEVRSR